MAGEIETECKSVVRKLPDALQPLERLSRNFWWSWAPDGAEIFRDLDPELWNRCEQNPRTLLARVSDSRLAQMVADSPYVSRVNRLAERFADYINHTKTSPRLHLGPHITRESPVAYFCAEYGIHNSLPLYSGGLGILAG
ncbi:MAG: alpha-glucan phosphorylase, partial [Acidobacteria bacterium]